MSSENGQSSAPSASRCYAAVANVEALDAMTKGMPIGVTDANGVPICVGDTLRFDPVEWGSDCEFVIQVRNGAIVGNGCQSDWRNWCSIVKRFNESA